MAKAYILPETLHEMHDGLSPIHRDRLLRDEASYASLLPGVKDIDEVMVLICGHGGRDARCGIMGPLLRSEFEDKIQGTGGGELELRTGPVEIESYEDRSRTRVTGSSSGARGVRVGLISHIGGHKFAGNVIVYLPPSLKREGGEPHPLAGHGIWYGRVEPKHVEGIIKETILNGNVVENLFRGGIDPKRRILRI